MLPTPPMRTTPTSQRDQPNWKCSGLTAAKEVTQKAPAMPPKKAGHKKGKQLVIDDIDSHGFGSDIVVANGNPGPADP